MTSTADMADMRPDGPQLEKRPVQVLPEPVVTTSWIAAVLKVSQKTVHRMIKRGEIEAFRLHREYRVKQSVWEAYYAGLDTGTAEPAVVAAP